jgi:RimJ/RimL family protein N-acetyltransferase
MTGCPTLETERLLLRPLEESDLDAYTEMLLQPEVRRSLRLPRTYSRSDAWRGMAQWRGQWELRGSGQWAVCERAGGEFVGRAGLHCPELPDWPGMEVGWTLHPAHWGKGYATEAAERSIAYAFEVLGVDEVFSVILPENERSQAVARRVGLTFLDERVLSSYPETAHGIWRLGRQQWASAGRDVSGDGDRRRPAPPRR